MDLPTCVTVPCCQAPTTGRIGGGACARHRCNRSWDRATGKTLLSSCIRCTARKVWGEKRFIGNNRLGNRSDETKNYPWNPIGKSSLGPNLKTHEEFVNKHIGCLIQFKFSSTILPRILLNMLTHWLQPPPNAFIQVPLSLQLEAKITSF